ncbi:MAG: HupE/UreJ family protein, partial [Halioglobus sp.]
LFFNIGVEAGQIIFIAANLTLLAVARHMMPVSRKAPVAVSYAIGSVASFWVFDRLYTTFVI